MSRTSRGHSREVGVQRTLLVGEAGVGRLTARLRVHSVARGTAPVVALLLCLAVLLSGCVMIPYQPESETKHDLADVPNPEQIRLSVGPRKFLEEMGEDLRDEDVRIEFIDGQTFIDTAAPDGDLSLARLLDPATRALIEPLQADYLVLFGEPENEVIENKGGMALYLGFFGAQKSKDTSRCWAAVVDLRAMRFVEQLTTSSTGTNAGVGLFYGIFIVSDTSASAQKGVTRNLAKTLAAAKADGPIKVVMLAREPRPSEEDLAVQARDRELQSRRVTGFSMNRAERYPPFSEPPAPAAGEGLVYLYRRYRLSGSLFPMIVSARRNGAEQEVVRVWSGGYLPWRIPAGEVTLWAGDQTGESLNLNVQSGATYYLRVETHLGWNAPRGELLQVDGAEAKPELILCRQLPDSRMLVAEAKSRAEDGYVFAQLELAQFYGSGVPYAPDESLPRDLVESYKWYTVIVMTEGIFDWMRETAARSRDGLTSQLSSEQLSEATRRAVEWHAAFSERVIVPPADRSAEASGPAAVR